MLRSSMLDIIERVRLLTGDNGATQVWSDAEIEGMLDQRRTEWRYLELQELDSIAAGGTVSYLIWQAPVGYWESDATVVDGSYNALTPSSVDYLIGRWTFASQPTNALATGKTYDVYAAAADLLEMWATKLGREYDFSAGGQSFSRGQQSRQLLELARQYRARQGVGQAKLVREDTN